MTTGKERLDNNQRDRRRTRRRRRKKKEACFLFKYIYMCERESILELISY